MYLSTRSSALTVLIPPRASMPSARAREPALTQATKEELANNQSLTGVSNTERFTLELEFINALANPKYLHRLAADGVLRDPAFVEYLRYLAYWEEPAYAKFVLYPHALRFRRELLREEFRLALENPRVSERVFAEQFEHWRTFRERAIADNSAVE